MLHAWRSFAWRALCKHMEYGKPEQTIGLVFASQMCAGAAIDARPRQVPKRRERGLPRARKRTRERGGETRQEEGGKGGGGVLGRVKMCSAPLLDFPSLDFTR